LQLAWKALISDGWPPDPFRFVAFRAALIFRGLIFQALAVLVDVMALGAVVDAGVFVVFIVDEDRRCALGLSKAELSTTVMSSWDHAAVMASMIPINSESAISVTVFIFPPALHSGFSMTS
jgi:hypothetical protein